MITKEKIIESINQLPEKFSVEEIIERIILLDKIDKGLADSKANKITPDSKIEEKLGRWFD